MTLSDGQATPDSDKDGHSLASIMHTLSTRRYQSKGFKRAQDHRTNFIHWSIKQLNFDKINKTKLELISGLTGTKWTYGYIRTVFHESCQQHGVCVVEQDSTYRSQRCNECGLVRKANRKGKIYTCKGCGLIIDADLNASKNHEAVLPEIT